MKEKLSFAKKEDGENTRISVILHDREGNPYSAAEAIIMPNTSRVAVGVHRSRGGQGRRFDSCEVLGDGCTFDARGVDGFPTNLRRQVKELTGELRQVHPTLVPSSSRLLELRAQLADLLNR